MARTIAIGGPPHSGKSVLIRSLARTGVSVYVVPEAPDGEGPGWSAFADQAVVKEIRRKGDFSDPQLWSALAEWASSLMENAQKISASLVLLDLGGLPSPENEAILRALGEGGGLIILARSDRLDTVPEWEALADRAGVPVVAVLVSDLHGQSRLEESEKDLFRATIAGLKRGREEEMAQDLTIRALARYLVPEEREVSELSWWDPVAARLDVPVLGRALGLEEKEGRLWWEPDVLPAVWATLARRQWPKEVLVGGFGPNWAYVAICHALHPSQLWLEDPKVKGGRVKISQLELAYEPRGPVTFEVTEGSAEYLQFQVFGLRIPGYLLDPAQLSEVQVPEPGSGKGIVFEGRAPLWLYVSVAEAVAHRVPWVGVAQPHLAQGKPGFVVAISHDPALSPGRVIPFVFGL